MALDDVATGKLARKLITVIREELQKSISSEIGDSLIATHLITASTLEVAGHLEVIEPGIEREDLHGIIERAISVLSPGSGIKYGEGETPIWIQVSIVHAGRTPLKEIADYRWIRLSTIDEVVPSVALGAQDDSRSWGWNLKVKTNKGDIYWASDRTFKGRLIDLAQLRVMNAIEAAVKAENQPAALSKHA